MPWIRSQDRKHLMDVAEIWEYNSNLYAMAATTSEPEILGQFSSSEAVLAQLDRTHDWIAKGAEGVWRVGD